MTTPHPNQLFESLLAAASHPVKKRNLSAVQSICERQHKTGSGVFTVAEIGRLLSAEGVMGAKSLLNPTSQDYRTLIEAWASFARPAKRATEAHDVSGDWLMRIPDPAIRTLVQATLAEVSKLRGEVAVLRKHQQPVTLYRGIAKPDAGEAAVVVVSPAERLTDGEREAVSHAVDPGYLAKHDLVIGKRGEIATASGRVVFDPGFAGGIKKLLGG